MTKLRGNGLRTGQVPAWWGKEDPKERARRLWKKTAPWHRSPVYCFRQGESGPDEGPAEVANGAAR